MPTSVVFAKEGVYTIDCKGCDKKYVGETKRKLKVRVKEHQTETEKVSKAVVYTRDRKRQSQSEMWGSALTDHSVKENHVINWESARIVEKERDDLARGIKEAIYIRKLPNLNRDEGRSTICPICTITSLGHQQAPRGGRGANTTEVGTVQSLPCSNPSAAVLCHNKPVLKKSPGW